MIDLHFTPTPNGQKISIALEEMELPYQLINYDIFEGDQHTAEFGKINPNHKPAGDRSGHDPPFPGVRARMRVLRSGVTPCSTGPRAPAASCPERSAPAQRGRAAVGRDPGR